LLKRVKNIFHLDLYGREKIGAGLAFIMYLLGNLLEIFSANPPSISATSDPAPIWITGILLSLAVIFVSVTSYKKYTHLLFTVLLFFLNFNIALSYFESTVKEAHAIHVLHSQTDVDPSLYLYTSFFIFFVTSQMLESRWHLLTITVFEVICFATGCFITRAAHPSLLELNQQLMFAFVMAGNYMIGIQRLRLTQISGDSSIQFKSISENARDIQCIINGDFKFMYINPAVKEISGYGFNDLNGKKFLNLVAGADQNVVLDTLNKIKQTPEEKCSVEYRVKTINGDNIWVESIFSGFKIDHTGHAELIFSETRNIEARKKLEEEIKQQLYMEEMLIKHSNQFINVGRTEIQQGIDIALDEFGKKLHANAVIVYRMSGKLQDEFKCTNQWAAEGHQELLKAFNVSIKINQQLVAFLRSLRGDKASHGNFCAAERLNEIEALNTTGLLGLKFYLVPLQSGNIANGFVVFAFDENIGNVPVSFFGLIGNMVSSAFTRMRTELRLHEAQLTNEAILRALPDWLYIINKSGEFTGANNSSTLPDYIPDYGLIGRTFADVMPVEIALSFSEALSQVIDTETPSSFEYYDNTIYKDRFFKSIIAPFKANEYLVIIRDITDLKQAQNELLSKAKKLGQSNKELEEFAYVVSHDMKQPIRTIISYLSLLKKKHLEALPAEAREFVNYSIEGANKMNDLIRDILQYSRLDQQLKMETNISLNNIVAKVCKALNETIVANNAEVICADLPAVTGNETMLTELFQNLIENGIKYNVNPRRIIQIKVTESPVEWLFHFNDNGIGFDQQYAQQIFKIFNRLHTDGEFQGTGIGLTICQKVVEKHGGQIWAESKKGVGSNFFFTLPKYG
jgi:PAS domain S-box-containing protein